VAEEGPLQILLGKKPFTVTLRTPGEDRKLALGLLFAEGLIQNREDVQSWREGRPVSGADSLHVELGCPVDENNLSNRSLASTSSCGLCGKTAWEPPAAGMLRSRAEFRLETLPARIRELGERQDLFGKTGGCHAAAIFAEDGRMLAFGEDVGRHNAVDKAVGELLEQGTLSEAYLLCVSGRVSYEIASKADRAGISVLAAVSAPSSLAVEFCGDAGITLLGFCRETRATAYARAERLIPAKEPAGVAA
jgi:FdhD protein